MASMAGTSNQQGGGSGGMGGSGPTGGSSGKKVRSPTSTPHGGSRAEPSHVNGARQEMDAQAAARASAARTSAGIAKASADAKRRSAKTLPRNLSRKG